MNTFKVKNSLQAENIKLEYVFREDYSFEYIILRKIPSLQFAIEECHVLASIYKWNNFYAI